MTATIDMDTIWEAEEEYRPKLESFAQEIRDALESAGFETSESLDVTDENLRLWIPVNDREHTIEIEMLNAPQMGDGSDHPNGVNFMLTIVGDGGRLLGGWSPYNYTPKCWVDASDTDALERRWELFKSVELNSIVSALEEDR